MTADQPLIKVLEKIGHLVPLDNLKKSKLSSHIVYIIHSSEIITRRDT